MNKKEDGGENKHPPYNHIAKRWWTNHFGHGLLGCVNGTDVDFGGGFGAVVARIAPSYAQM